MSKEDPMDLQKMWDNDTCPSVNGIYYPDGSAIILNLRKPKNLFQDDYSVTVVKETTLQSIKADPGFFLVSSSPSAEFDDASRDIRVYGGETSYGSDGFIAVVNLSDKKLRWLIFFDNSNPFMSVSLEGDTVIGITNLDYVWRIPLDEPQSMTIELAKQSPFQQFRTDPT